MSEPVGLVVDDNERVRAVIAEALRRDGMRVFEAASGSQALSLVDTVPLSFVLTDLDMPEMDGLELCRRLRSSRATADLPIVVVSGSAATQMEQAIAAGCDAVLAKPCSMAELVATIRRLLEDATPVAPPG